MAISLFVLLIFCSCEPIQSNKKPSEQGLVQNNLERQLNGTNDSLKWRQDSLGCMHSRSPVLFDTLFFANKMIDKNKDEFLYFFGKPNKQEKVNDRIIFIYYFDSVCLDNKIVKNSDKSSIIVSFNLKNIFLEKDTRIE